MAMFGLHITGFVLLQHDNCHYSGCGLPWALATVQPIRTVVQLPGGLPDQFPKVWQFYDCGSTVGHPSNSWASCLNVTVHLGWKFIDYMLVLCQKMHIWF